MFESDTSFDFDNIEFSNIPKSTTVELSSNLEPGTKIRRLDCDSLSTSQQFQKLLKKLDVLKSPCTTKIVPRKFPGPAGLLTEFKDIKKVEQEIVCSQTSINIFQDGPWECMMNDFHSNKGAVCLPEKYNIAWIKKAVTNGKLINGKAPFLAGVIETVDCSKTKLVLTFSIVLKDVTGTVGSTITVSNNLFEEFSKLLVNGTVIILKQFGVLINENNSVHITTTSNNLVRIYTASDVVLMQDFEISDFISKLNEMKHLHKLKKPKCFDSPLQPVLSDICKKPISAFETSNFSLSTSCKDNPLSTKRKFQFKQKTSKPNTIGVPENLFQNVPLDICNPSNVNSNVLPKSDVLENVFEGIDTNALFEDF